MFYPQDLQAVLAGEVQHATTPDEELCRYGFSDGVGDEVECPVEHFDQEREFGEDAGVDIIGKSRIVWCLDGGESAARSSLRS